MAFIKAYHIALGTDGSGANHLIVKTGASRQKAATGLSMEDDEGHVWHNDYLYMNGGAIFNGEELCCS